MVLPTETVYGLAADPRAEGAIERLFSAKGRSRDKPVALFAADLTDVERAAGELEQAARVLAARFWPGPPRR